MLKMPKLSLIAVLVSTIALTACNEKKTEATKTVTPNSTAVEQKPVADNSMLIKDPSYAVGVLVGSDIKGLMDVQKEAFTYDNDKLIAGVRDAIEGKADLQNEEIVNTLKAFDEKLRAETQAKADAAAQKAKEEGNKFAAEFAQKEGVKKTESGLFYRIESEGYGEIIKPTDNVKVHYVGSLPNGTVFDSSRERDQPAEFQLNQVIDGWTEGLQLVKKGGKIELVIPPELAYGDQDLGAIPANSTLHFEVEVLDVIPETKSDN